MLGLPLPHDDCTKAPSPPPAIGQVGILHALKIFARFLSLARREKNEKLFSFESQEREGGGGWVWAGGGWRRKLFPPHTSMEQTNERASERELHISSSSAYVSEEKNLRLRLAYIFLIFLYTRQRAELGIQFIH